MTGAYGQRAPAGPGGELVLLDGERKSGVVVRLWKQAAIGGRVLDEAGEPLVNVNVHAYSRRSSGDRRFAQVRTAATDDRGVYRLALLDPGEYVVGVVPRSVALPSTMGDAKFGAPGFDARNEINAYGSSGTANALTLKDQLYTIGAGAPIPAVRGDRVFIYPPLFYPSVADVSQAARIALASGEERDGIDLQLQPSISVRVSGMVTGITDGSAVPVRLVPSYNSQIDTDLEIPATVTDPSGSFTFPAVVSGEYLLRTTTFLRIRGGDAAAAEDMQFADIPLSVGQSDLEGIALPLRPGLRIRGRVEFEGAVARPASVSSVYLTIEPVIGPPVPPSYLNANVTDDGGFSSRPLFPGRYYVRVSGSPTGWMFRSATLNGRDVADIPIELGSGDVSDVLVTFSDRWSGLSGSVSASSGAPATEGLVIVFPTDPLTWESAGMNPRRLRSTVVTNEGRYTFPVLPPGDYYVSAIARSQSAGWRDPRFLESAARTARRVTISDGERSVQDVRIQEVR